jgi:hypothetical protein
MALEIQVLAWNRLRKVAGLNWLIIRSQHPHLIIGQYRYKQTLKNLYKIYFLSKRWHRNVQYNSWVNE